MTGDGGGLRGFWIGGSAGGAWVGAHLALIAFPGAGFARNPTGRFGWHLVGFALTIGLCYALAQLPPLLLIARRMRLNGGARLLLWVPATAIGISTMILPLWWTDAMNIVLAPWVVIVPMAPGLAILAAAQWAVLRWSSGMGEGWVAPTIVGAVVGSVLGVVVALVVVLSMPRLVGLLFGLETTWALIMGGCLAAFQAPTLTSRTHARAVRL